jgi:hypothetical protein
VNLRNSNEVLPVGAMFSLPKMIAMISYAVCSSLQRINSKHIIYFVTFEKAVRASAPAWFNATHLAYWAYSFATKKIKRCESFLIALINSGAAQVSFIIIANHFLLA